MYMRLIVVVLLISQATIGRAALPLEAELSSIVRIWGGAPHSAFTDLVYWRDHFHCAFREGRGHVSADGKIRVICSPDGATWTAARPIALDRYDLRDAHLSVTPDGRLMLLGGAAPREKDNQGAPTGSFVAFSDDGMHWSKPRIVVEPGRWLWSVTWHEGKAYGVSYTAGPGQRYLNLLASEDGVAYEPHVRRLLAEGYPNEATLRFEGGTCYALVRRDRRDEQPYSAMLGISRGDFTDWQWHDLGEQFNSFGGPNLIQLPTGYWLAAWRMHPGGAHTALCHLDVVEHRMTRLLKLPSGGDTSYPGLVWHDGLLHVSYYSSHEGRTSIYLAKVKIRYRCPTCGSTMRTVPMLVGLPNEEMEKQVRRGQALLAGCVGDPHNPEFACVCAKCGKWKTARMAYWQDLPREFDTTEP